MGEGQNTSEKKRTSLLSWLKPSGKEERKQAEDKRTAVHRQAMFAHTVNTAPPPTKIRKPKQNESPPDLSSPMPGIPSKDFKTHEDYVNTFNKITKNPPKPTTRPIYHPAPKATPESSPLTNEPAVNTPPERVVVQPSEANLPKKKERRLDPVAARESLKKAGWGTKNPSLLPEQPKPQTSVAPFKPKSFPGVEKWQPGKGAIDNKMAQEIRKEVKDMPENSFEKTAPEIKQNEPTPTPTATTIPAPQKKVKEVT